MKDKVSPENPTRRVKISDQPEGRSTLPKGEDLLPDRLWMYSFLHLVFSQIPGQWIFSLSLPSWECTAHPGLDQIESGLTQLREWLSLIQSPIIPPPKLESLFQELKEDYTRLFLGTKKTLAPPWESVYRSAQHLSFQMPALEVRKMYLQTGLAPEKLGIEPDDHLALELAFMIHLLEREGLSLGAKEEEGVWQYRAIQQEFLTLHLLQWIPQFARAIEENAATDFYRGAALLLEGFLKFDFYQLCLSTRSECAKMKHQCWPIKY